MATRLISLLGILLLLSPAGAQRRGPRDPFGKEPEMRMPDGRSRELMILKSDTKKSSEDMSRVLELAAELQDEIERNRFHTVDVGSIRKAEEIIKLVRRVKGRLSRSR